MKAVKLSEVKVGDVIYDHPTNGIKLKTKVVAHTYILFSTADEHGYKEDENGLIRFSIFSQEDFYKI